jgi:hypothetical protein
MTPTAGAETDLRSELEDLRNRLRLLEDERELRSLLARYAFCADLGRSREWVSLYTEDGAVDLGDTVASMSGGQPPPGYPARPRLARPKPPRFWPMGSRDEGSDSLTK